MERKHYAALWSLLTGFADLHQRLFVYSAKSGTGCYAAAEPNNACGCRANICRQPTRSQYPNFSTCPYYSINQSSEYT